MHLLTVKGREATFAMVLITADLQLRKRDIEVFCGNPYPYPPTPPTPKEVTALIESH